MGAHVLSRLICGAMLGAWSTAGLANHGGSADAWWHALIAAALAASGVIYAVGVANLWRHAGVDRGIRRIDVACFSCGWLLLVIALAPPVEELTVRSFAVHMAQHEVLMVAAAPLLVLSRPLAAFVWALPAALLRPLGRSLGGVWRMSTAPTTAWSVHALALWVWHIPVLFVAASGSPALHALQHLCFFLSAILFWSAVFANFRHDAHAVACLFTTMLHTSALGMLITFARSPWYQQAGGVFGLTPLEDQQLGGLIMWVPGAFAYVLAGLAIVGRWLAQPGVHRDAA